MKTLWIVLAVQILSVIGLLFIPCSQKQEPFSMELRGEEGTPLFQLKSDGNEGTTEYTQEFPLSKGDYILDAKYTCSTGNNTISVQPDSLSSERVGRSSWTFPDPKTDHAKIGFSLAHDVPDVKIAVYGQDKEGFTIESIKITKSDVQIPAGAMTAARIVTWVFFCLISDIFILLMIRYPAKRKIYAALLIASVVMTLSIIWPVDYLTSGEDLFFHINRIFGIREGLLSGTPWVKLQQNWYNGYGYAVGIFYGDALLYFPAVFNIAGIDMQISFKLFVFLLHLLTVCSAYYCFSRMYDEKTGCCSAIFYGFLLFRWIDLYHRSAVGEFCAMAFLPFLIYAVYLLWNDDFAHSRLMFVIGFTGILQTHLITCEMAMLMVFALLIGSPRRTFSKKRILSLSTSAAWVLLVNLSFVVPFLDFSSKCRVTVMNNSATNMAIFLNQKISYSLYQLITFATVQVFIVFIIAVILRLRYLYSGRSKKEKNADGNKSRFPVNLLLVLTALFIFAGTSFFPWKQIIKIGFLTMPVTSIQFVWRFLAVSGVFATVIICEILSRLFAGSKNHRYAALCLLTVMLLPGLVYSFIGTADKTFSRFSFDSSALISKWCSLEEYLIAGTDSSDVVPEFTTSGDVKITSYSKEGTKITFTYEAGNGGTVELPVFNYPYYRAEADGTQIPVEDGTNHRIRLNISRDSKGTLHVQFRTPVLWILSLTASILGILILAVLHVFKKPSKNEEADNHLPAS